MRHHLLNLLAKFGIIFSFLHLGLPVMDVLSKTRIILLNKLLIFKSLLTLLGFFHFCRLLHDYKLLPHSITNPFFLFVDFEVVIPSLENLCTSKSAHDGNILPLKLFEYLVGI